MIPWIFDKLSWKKSFLVRSEILGLFVNRLSVEYKYSRRNMHNFPEEVQAQLSQKRKDFYGFFIAFIKFTTFLKKIWAF